MANISSRDEVEAFLANLRDSITAEPKRIRHLDRLETRAFLLDQGLNERNLFDLLTDLQVSEYSHGPELDDKGRPGEIWIFGINLNGIEVYVKIVQLTPPPEKGVTHFCLSFHEARYPMSFPHAEGQD